MCREKKYFVTFSPSEHVRRTMDLQLPPVGNGNTDPIAGANDDSENGDASTISISTITNRTEVPEMIITEEIAARNSIGQHPTPPMRQLVVDEAKFEEGYDSEGEVGPFYHAVRGEEVEIYHEDCVRDESPASEVTVEPVPEVAENPLIGEKFQMSDADLQGKLKRDLVALCKDLGLNVRGNKGDLIDRLKKARADGVVYLTPDQAADPNTARLASDGFSPLAKWQYLSDKDEVIDLTDELEVDGVKYRAPTTPREEFERTGVGKGGKDNLIFLVKSRVNNLQKRLEFQSWIEQAE